jgi:branched-chain amino acid transport system ATP-binding protein
MLAIHDLTAGYGGRTIVAEFGVTVAAGEIVALLGHNGAGKSTVLKAVFNLLPDRRGTVALDGRPLERMKPHELLEAGLAYVPQDRSTFPKLTVAENLRMGGFALPDEAVLGARLESVFALFPALRARRHEHAGQLSGGEQRMLEIARTLLVAPKAIMLDEPSIGLAPKMVASVFAAIRTLARSGCAILLVEQNVKQALLTADRALVMEMGRVVLEDEAAALRADDRLGRLYMGAASPPR